MALFTQRVGKIFFTCVRCSGVSTLFTSKSVLHAVITHLLINLAEGRQLIVDRFLHPIYRNRYTFIRAPSLISCWEISWTCFSNC